MQKKIFIPSYDFKPALGGVANYVHEIALAWTKMGHQVLILARAQDGDTTFDSKVPYKVIRIRTPKMAFLSVPFFTRHIRSLAADFKPNYIYCPLWFPDGAAVYFSKVYTKIPFYIAAHGSEVFLTATTLKQKLRSLFLLSLQKNIFSNAKKIFAVSHYTRKKLLLQPGTTESKTITVNNGVNPERYYKKTSHLPGELAHVNGKKILLTVTRLHAYKGVDIILKSLPAVLEKVPQLHYVVVGIGPDLKRLEKIIDALQLQNNVTLLGAVSYQCILDLYNSSTLFTMLSREELPEVEGFGLVFLEAAACGLPSLAGYSGGIPDAIDDLRSGWLVDPTSVEQVTLKLQSLLTSTETLKKAADYCLQMAPKKTWAVTAQTILDAIYEV